MEPYQLMQAWRETGERLAIFPSAVFDELPVPAEAKAFLGQVGLPESAAPFLDFAPPKTGVLPTVAQLWRLKDVDLDGYYVIGSNGSGDSIAVGPAGAVYYLNHDAGFSPCYINRDVRTMSEVLLCYRQLVEAALAAGGPDGFLDGAVTSESTTTLRRLLEARDPHALTEGSMWAEELDALGG